MQIGINIAVKGAQTSGSSSPVNTVAPVISGNTTIGSTLTLTSVGSYTGTAPITYTYQWYRGVTVIIGQTSTTYITQSADAGLQVTCQVQASNAYGSTFTPSNYIIPVALFATTWTTTAPNQTITLPYVPTGTYSGTINWGDSTTSVNNGTVTTHTYATAGTYTVIITGDCIGWDTNSVSGSTYWTSVVNWGQLQLGTDNFGYNFAYCPNLDLSSVQGTLDLTGVTVLEGLFYDCGSLTTINNINSWDTSVITNMNEMFSACFVFNQSLSFNTSAVEFMNFMFADCQVFNQSLSFNTSSVTSMISMFKGCTSFNQPLSFNTSSVANMSSMFNGATAFNQPLTFNTSAVTDMSQMFNGATVFNQPLSFDTAAVQYMNDMFNGCTNFNQPLTFNTVAVTNMVAMFYGATSFNQALSFNTVAVNDMAQMFQSCSAFNQPLSFNTAAVTYMGAMFQSCSAFNQPLSFNTAAVTDMISMFNGCTSFNQPLTFNTSAVLDMETMFSGCTSFNQSLSFDTSAVVSMGDMFNSCQSFNQPLSFNTAAVTYMGGMFSNCTSFNQPLSFNTVAVTDMSYMFYGCTAFNQPLSFNTSAVTTMETMFSGATAFNQNIGSWNVANVTNFANFMSTKTPATFSTTNLDAIYNGWVTVQSSRTISFGTAKYSAAGVAGRNYLTGTKLWTITDGGLASAPFTSTWLVTAGETITLPYEAAGTYSGTIDWGDSTTSVNSYANRTHTYATAGTKTISITGVTTGFRFNNTGSKLNIRTITNWGTLRLGNGTAYFHGCTNLTLTTVVGTLDLTGTTNMLIMFANCTSLTTVNGINSWSTGSVTNMSNMFNSCTNFNQPLSFNTAAVANMSSMFYGCTNFNQALSFNTAAVTNMSAMFQGCTNFNQALTFNTAAVTNMSQMFAAANAFQQNIGSWNVANVTNFTFFMSTKTPATFSTTNLDAIYNGWVTVQSSRTITFGTAKYSAAGVAGRNYLTGTKLWTITDGGL